MDFSSGDPTINLLCLVFIMPVSVVASSIPSTNYVLVFPVLGLCAKYYMKDDLF